VNVLVYAFREDSEDHPVYKNWLMDVLNGEQAFGMCDPVLSGFLRIVTHPRIYKMPTPLKSALDFVDNIRSHPDCVIIPAGPGHWKIFEKLCQATGAKGSHISDAYLAALAMDSGSEWITCDRDYSRYAGLRWRHPLDSE
jgi:uncharacterized protein